MSQQPLQLSNRTALVVFSGGQDSTTCLFGAKQKYENVHALTIEYGQRHKVEIQAAAKIAAMARVTSHQTAILGPVLKSTSPLVSTNTLEQYEDFNNLPGGIEKTFVPMRNQLFLTIAINRAIALGAGTIITGVCEEDYGGYPDCRRAFIEALEIASNLGLAGDVQHTVTIETPLMYLTKAETVELAMGLPGCYKALAYSHTSYDGQYPPTGKDHATLLRAKGFAEAGVPDPLVLRAVREGVMALPFEEPYMDANVVDDCLELVFPGEGVKYTDLRRV